MCKILIKKVAPKLVKDHSRGQYCNLRALRGRGKKRR
jgi:hypothetical protein